MHKKASDSLFKYLAQSTGMSIQSVQMVTAVVTSVVTGAIGMASVLLGVWFLGYGKRK